MHFRISCIATSELLQRNNLPYIHFNDAADLEGLNRNY